MVTARGGEGLVQQIRTLEKPPPPPPRGNLRPTQVLT